MLLILSDQFDPHADRVEEKLKLKSIKSFRLNLDVASLKETKVTFKNNTWAIKKQHNGQEICINEVSVVWCRRPFVQLNLDEEDDKSIDFKIWKGEWNRTLIGIYSSLRDKRWLNPLQNTYRGENKFYQMEIASDLGFKMPKTMVSNDRQELIKFSENFEHVTFKMLEQCIYKNEQGVAQGIYATKISPEELYNFGSHEENPIVIQEYINKDYEVRYTVVGDTHLVCKIDSQKSITAKDDWRRYDIPNTPHHPISAPEEIRVKVSALMEKLGISYGALDFIITPSGDWIFLEINCMGQWLWIEDLTGLDISGAIANWLVEKINKEARQEIEQ